MDIIKRRPAALSMLADSSFRNYFIADAPFEFGAEVRRFAMGWAALTLTVRNSGSDWSPDCLD